MICKAFEQSGATTCEINSNILSDSTIETTLATTTESTLLGEQCLHDLHASQSTTDTELATAESALRMVQAAQPTRS